MPGSATGTGNAKAENSLFPPRLEGTVVVQVLVAVLKAVVATVAVGEKVMSPFGTFTVYGVPFAVKVMVDLSRRILTRWEPIPPTLRTLLNQMTLP